MTPKEKQYLTYGAAAIGLFILYKVVTPKTDTSGGSYDPTGNGGAVSTLPGYVFNANTIAAKLYDAMKDTGTDVPAILKALTPVSASQFSQVMQAFGKRSYNSSLGNQYALPWFPLPLHDLPFWLKSELSDSDYATLALKYPQL